MTTDRINIDPAIMMGKPVIRGTRITVELILRKFAEGFSEDQLLADYPHISKEDIRAAWHTALPAWRTRKSFCCQIWPANLYNAIRR